MAVGFVALVGFGICGRGVMKRAARRFHRRYWIVFGILVPVSFFVVLSMKQSPPENSEPVLLEGAN